MQSAVAGMALSGVAMLVAAFGWLPPVAGALTQEAINVAVILNARRALGPRRRWGRQPMPAAAARALREDQSIESLVRIHHAQEKDIYEHAAGA